MILTTFQKSFLRSVEETIALGVPPDRALKLWGMVVEAHLKREGVLLKREEKEKKCHPT